MDNAQESRNLPKKIILIAEDDFYIRDLYVIQARKAGYFVIEAIDGQELLDKVKEHPDLILLDIMLPKINGLTALRRIKENPQTSNIPVIVVTNSEDLRTEQEAKSLGVYTYLLKIKNSPDQVISAIKTYFESS